MSLLEREVDKQMIRQESSHSLFWKWIRSVAIKAAEIPTSQKRNDKALLGTCRRTPDKG